MKGYKLSPEYKHSGNELDTRDDTTLHTNTNLQQCLFRNDKSTSQLSEWQTTNLQFIKKNKIKM